MDEVVAAALAGLVAGLAVAMPLGAIGVLIVQEGMSGGWRPAAAGATGVALVDLAYSAVAVVAGAGLAQALEGWERSIQLAGALLLVVIAVRGLVRLVRSDPAGGAGPDGEDGFAGVAGGAGVAWREVPADEIGPVWRVGARFVGLTAVNPLTAVYFVALAAGLGTALAGRGPVVAFVVAVFVASLAWQLTLAVFGALAGARLPRGARWVTGVAGYVVVLG